MSGTRSHWEEVYTTKAETAVSWFQPHSVQSLELIASAAPNPASAIVDIGGGASRLVDDLIAQSYTDLTVLDVAEAALVKSRSRLRGDDSKVAWIVADITDWRPARAYDVWHDRAVFHFLTEPAQQEAYLSALRTGTSPGSTVVMATFALDGPEKCSGLPVQRYSPETLATRLGPTFSLTGEANETHETPWGAEQRFSYATFRRLSS
ncbi:class I SAM-dependent methyltransferase [Reyranella sp.]|uniref:class I SAM-dependent methyltransferase n=1 Tax=Reyranella sp. TaxID=1929291 RepID=UPI003C7A378B